MTGSDLCARLIPGTIVSQGMVLKSLCRAAGDESTTGFRR
jgi:hypothetical protein